MSEINDIQNDLKNENLSEATKEVLNNFLDSKTLEWRKPFESDSDDDFSSFGLCDIDLYYVMYMKVTTDCLLPFNVYLSGNDSNKSFKTLDEAVKYAKSNLEHYYIVPDFDLEL